jgi:hypothetical protein
MGRGERVTNEGNRAKEQERERERERRRRRREKHAYKISSQNLHCYFLWPNLVFAISYFGNRSGHLKLLQDFGQMVLYFSTLCSELGRYGQEKGMFGELLQKERGQERAKCKWDNSEGENEKSESKREREGQRQKREEMRERVAVVHTPSPLKEGDATGEGEGGEGGEGDGGEGEGEGGDSGSAGDSGSVGEGSEAGGGTSVGVFAGSSGFFLFLLYLADNKSEVSVVENN